MKKNLFYLSVIAASVAACNNASTSGNASQTTHQPATVPVTTTQTEAPMPYYKGLGNEPGFLLLIDMNIRGDYEVELVNNYGADTLRGSFQKAPLYTDGKANMASSEVKLTGVFETMAGGESATISLFGAACTDDAGKSWASSCAITFGKVKLQGCGQYLE